MSNGVKQGGVLSPFHFKMYMNNLSVLNNSVIGDPFGDYLIYHLTVYAILTSV